MTPRKGFSLFCFLVVLYINNVQCDVYLHNPRGSNDRLNEANTNRNNANRLFNSQNNGKGGYCYGPEMTYYEGSQLTVEWTNQHGCGNNPKLYCNIVIQYMCGQTTDPAKLRVRDGSTTDTIPFTEQGVAQTNGDGKYTFGMHEGYDYYAACKVRQRNLGLFIADRETEGGLSPNGRRFAIYTRQENNDNRHGYECPEEKDYYPYWAWTPWRDIAILTYSDSSCSFYQKESQNVKSRFECRTAAGAPATPITKELCQSGGNTWVERPAWNIAAPDCVVAPFARDNHLGNGESPWANTYNWTIPKGSSENCIDADNCECVLRLRYNISTFDLGDKGNNPDSGFIDSSSNGKLSPVQNDDHNATQDGNTFQLAMNTAQYGRTFQDRSYVFFLKPRPDGVDPNARIFNLNVRGKRGNIVEVYPAVEYDFAPETLNVYVGDYVHFQWTGCDTNPQGNAGEGTAGTDRSNMVQIETKGANYPASDGWLDSSKKLFPDDKLRKRMAYLDQTNCLTFDQLMAKHNNNENDVKTDTQNCMKLNAATSPYFNGGLQRMSLASNFYYMSTRNNNFSNRGQKGTVRVARLLPNSLIGVVAAGGALFAVSGGVGASMMYAKSHPHSKVAQVFSKF